MKVEGRLTHQKGGHPVARTKVVLVTDKNVEVASTHTAEDGTYCFPDVGVGNYKLQGKVFGVDFETPVHVAADRDSMVPNEMDLGFEFKLSAECDCKMRSVTAAVAGKRCILSVDSSHGKTIGSVLYRLTPPVEGVQPNKTDYDMVVPHGVRQLKVAAEVAESGNATHTTVHGTVEVAPGDISQVQGDVGVRGDIKIAEAVNVRLNRTASDPTLDQALWVAIRNRTRAMSFERYRNFMNIALTWEEREAPRGLHKRVALELERDELDLGANLHGVGAYQTLKLLTEAFLLLECGVRIEPGPERHRVPFDPYDESRRLGRTFSFADMEKNLRGYLGDRVNQLPYITRVVEAAFRDSDRDGSADRLLCARRINEPCLIELIWSYWMEEGMLVQTMNAVTQRFQNVRSIGDRDPLQNLEIDPLRPLNNLLWGYVQDEFNRLTVRRRAYEYTHHYGLTLYGKATAGMRTAESRSKFLEAFHNLLYQTSVFFKEDFQTTVIADGFPLLNSLREVHLILAQGAHNQFGDLPWTSRVEMMLMQFMLARREVRDFLQARVMVPYREPWEAQVDAMKGLQGWTDVTVSHFRDLAVYGEQLLLSIRYGDWIADNDEYSAINWARYFRPEIQGYLHAYRAATGIDLTNADTVDATIPGIHLQKRMAGQRGR